MVQAASLLTEMAALAFLLHIAVLQQKPVMFSKFRFEHKIFHLH